MEASKKTTRQVNKLLGRAQYKLQQGHLTVYTLRKGGMESPRFQINRAVSFDGLLNWVMWKVKENGTEKFPVPVIHLQNDQAKDDRGFRRPITEEILQTCRATGRIILAEKHLLDIGTLKYLEPTFRTAVDARAYAKALCAAVVGSGGPYDLMEGAFEFRDITSQNALSETIHCGADGRGSIHPNHWIFKVLGMVCVIQVRLWNQKAGVFIKGILVPDERCLDSEGRPSIWIDWEMVKGVFKPLAKSRSGFATGAFNKDGVLVNKDALKVVPCTEGYSIGILQTWGRPGTIRWCFEILEKLQDSRQNRAIIKEFVKNALKELEENGGLGGIFEKICDKDSKLTLLSKLCEKIGLDPLRIPYVFNLVQEDLKRWLFHLRQGAGRRALRYVCVIDNAVPEGRCVIAPPRKGEPLPEDMEIAVTRFPMILPQALRIVRVCDTGLAKWRHLKHLLLKDSDGAYAPQWVIFMNQADLVAGMQGDDDGDVVLVETDEEVVEMFRTRLPLLNADPDATMLIEPGKLASNPKAKIPLLGRHGEVSDEALTIIGLSGQGPVGQLTYYHSMFMALGMPMHALACSVMVQEAIDSEKHAILLSDPTKLVIPSNWEQVRAGVWRPKDLCKAPVNGKWYDNKTGTLNMAYFAGWAKNQTGGYKPSDILNWRPGDDSNKKSSEIVWGAPPPPSGGNLVHYCNEVALESWMEYKEECMASEKRDMDLSAILINALTHWTGYHYAVEPYTDLKDPEYNELLRLSGLPKFGKAVSKIMRENLEPDVRNQKVTAEHEMLCIKLRSLSLEQLLLIWKTEHEFAKLEPQKKDSHINRAFRAVIFEGSPVLAELDIDMDVGCSYLTANRLETIFEALQKQVKDGEKRTIFHAVVDWADTDTDHKAVTGVEACECEHCKETLEYRAVSFVRSHNERLNKPWRKYVATTCHEANMLLRKGATLYSELPGGMVPPPDDMDCPPEWFYDKK